MSTVGGVKRKNVRHTIYKSTSKRSVLAAGVLAAGICLYSSSTFLFSESINALRRTTSSAVVDGELNNIITEQAKITEFRSPQYSDINDSPRLPSCAPREGLIIVNTLGRLANNLFEVGFANRMATELCWKVLYRPCWQGEIPNPRAAECFPHAMLPKVHTLLDNVPFELQEKLRLNSTFWENVSVKGAQGNHQYQSWLDQRLIEGIGVEMGNNGSLFVGDSPHRLVQRIRNEASRTSLLSLKAFFIHGDWMSEFSDNVREWFTMSDSCCHHEPPENAVVIHVRDFEPSDHTNMGIKPSAYIHIMNHYNLTHKPLWIVCQPQTVESAFVKALVAAFPNSNLTIVTGQDQYDAFCTLTRAKTLLLTSASSFSQMGAFLSDAQVHYPLTTLHSPRVTLSVLGWKYHLVDQQTLDKVIQFDVGRDQIEFQPA